MGDVAALSATSPLFVAIIAPFFLHERSEPILWFCAAMSLGGVALIAQPKLETAGVLIVLTLAHALTSALGNMFMRRLGPHASAEAIVLHFAVVSALALLAISVWTWTWPSPRGWLLMGATGLTGCLAQLAQTRAYALVPAARIGIFGYIGTLFTQVVACVMLDEKVDLHQITGMALIVISGMILLRARPAAA